MQSSKSLEIKQKELEHPDKKKKRWWSLRKIKKPISSRHRS